ncbi:MAG: cytochrome b N-terminal domain-containing protein, partial [Solirubrobacteraceae bacterium]
PPAGLTAAQTQVFYAGEKVVGESGCEACHQIGINGTGPFLGPYLSDFLRGGPEFGATTLSRFYAIHMMLIPGLIAALIGAHLYLIMKLGISAPPWMKVTKEDDEAPEMREVHV